jgi:8-oxo-dGTP diphosphatase
METAVEVVCALVLRDGDILMGERKPHKVYPLHWEFPGGKIEPGETPLEALRRELLEELDIEIEFAEEWMRETNTYSNGMTYDVRYFLIREWSGEIINLEFNRILWVSREVLPDLIHLSGNKNIIERLWREDIPS